MIFNGESLEIYYFLNRKQKYTITPEETISNIIELSDTLLRSGRKVFIATIPQYNQAFSDGIKLCNRERNIQLKEYIEKYV